VLLSCQTLLGSTDPDAAVAGGREALDKWWWESYPWYDPARDEVRRIDVSEPWWDWGWFSAGNSWLPDSVFQWLAWLVIATLLTILVYLMIRSYLLRANEARLAGARGGGRDTHDDRRRVEALPAGDRLGQMDLLAEARRNFQAGNYRDAIIYLFSYQLLQLDKGHFIRLAKGKTNRQYLRELAGWRPLRRLVEETMVAFEEVFFGHHAIDRARFESCWSRLDEFETLVEGGAV
jgi:hypothetical protein